MLGLLHLGTELDNGMAGTRLGSLPQSQETQLPPPSEVFDVQFVFIHE
jgi:hypothetical protein